LPSHVKSELSIDALASDSIDAIRTNAAHFPSHVQSRGRLYLAEGRVGQLEVERNRISATIRGRQNYRTTWQWDRTSANPRCTCPEGPICKHAFALARAIEGARSDRAATAGNHRGRVRDDRQGDHGGDPFRADLFREDQVAPERVRAELTSDLAHWARRHAEAPTRVVRAAFGLHSDAGGRPAIWMEVRLTTPRLVDAPRSARHVLQLASELRRDPLLLAPPHARLMRFLARTVPNAEPLTNGTRFGLKTSTINRLLDSFSDSPLTIWADDDDAAADQRGDRVRGARLRLGEVALDIVPSCSGQGPDMRITLAARWPDGRLRPLEDVIYLPSDDDLHPSLILADGAFWRVAEEPPPQLMKRFAITGDLLVPELGRTRFLGLLASSFSSVASALAPHIHVHHVRPVITLDLYADDWLRVRLFAYTGEDAWRPGVATPDAVGFELDAEGQWLRLPVALEGTASIEERAPVGAPEDIADDTSAIDDPHSIPDAETEAASTSVWIDLPDPEQVEPARRWLGQLPIVRRNAKSARGRPPGSASGDTGAWIHLGARSLEAFAEAWERRPRDILFLGNERMQHLLAEKRTIRPRVTVTASGVDWFTVSAEWQAEGSALSEDDLMKLRTARTRYVKLASGWVRRDWVETFDAAADVLADLGIEAGTGEQRLTLTQLAQARPESLAALEAFGGDPNTIREIERLRERVLGFEGLPRIPVAAGLETVLRPYQRDGLDFLAFVTGLGLGAILADDMGLGKTVQALAWIEWLRERDPKGGPALVVCPASVVHNWQREAERFTPQLRVLTLTSGEERHTLWKEVPDHDVVVTTYALLRRDLARWRLVPLRAAILDEAQNIKNPAAAVSRAVLELNARYRLALTGTPIENRALDLWSIMQFVNPGYLGRRTAFAARYDRPDTSPHLRRLLAARLRPVMVRRLKERVAPELPDRIEETRECELTPGQRKLYLAELTRGRATMERLKASPDGVMGHKFEILVALTRLRQVCCHPALVGGRDGLGSGKFDTLFEILEPLLAEGRKVLVFSQFVECLKLLEASMKVRGIGHHVLTGATTKREAVITAFETDPEPCVFLISLKAGGAGLNLTAASYVVLFDPWWNPAVEAQAIDRAHRIGQTRTVIAYRMLAAGTIEEKIWELQQRKAALVADVLGEDGFARALTQTDLDYLLG
jgi:superfamily II DNA or RNA helicase